MGLFFDDQGNVYEVENVKILTPPKTVTVYDETGGRFELSIEDADTAKLGEDKVQELLRELWKRCSALLNRHYGTFPESAFARAPEASFARAPEAAFARAPEAAFARAPDASFARAPGPSEAYIYYPVTGKYYRIL